MVSINVASTTVLDEWAAAWSAHDLDRVASLFTEDCVYEDVALGVVNRGKDQLRAFGAAFLAGVPDLRVELTLSIATDDRAAMEWVMSGTHTGDLPAMPASGKSFSIRGATVCELAHTKNPAQLGLLGPLGLLEAARTAVRAGADPCEC